MKLLLLTTRLFAQPASGGELCSARLIAQLLALGHSVHVVGRGAAPPVSPASPGLRHTSLGPLVPALAQMGRPAALLSLAGALLRRRAWTAHRVQAGAALRRARRLLGGPALAEADLLIVDHLQAWAWLAGLPAALHDSLPPRLLLMHNLEAAAYRPADAAPGAGRGLRAWVLAREARLLAALELQALQASAAVACLSADDALALQTRSALPVPVQVLPAFALALPAATHLAGAPGSPMRRRIGLIGTWTWAPNRRALQWVLDAVRPLLPAHCELVLAGAGLDDVPPLPGVRLLGRVADVETFYAAIDVIAIAALDGSGVQEKAVEAFATTLPVVATPLALRALQPWPPGVSAAADAAAFARACSTLQAGRSLQAAAAWAARRRQLHRQAVQRWLQAGIDAPAPPPA